MKREFILKGLDCPNCASKIEKEVGNINGVESSAVNLMRETLTVVFDESAEKTLERQIKQIVYSHEPEVRVMTSGKVDEGYSNEKGLIARFVIGALVLALAIFFDHSYGNDSFLTLPLFIISYILLGADVLLKAVKNIIKGSVFDENFLMSISTLGAFAIGEYHEAVAVMLFYQVGEYFQSLAVRRSRRSISALMDIRPDVATLLKDGVCVAVPSESVNVGDTILVKAGERVPLDGTVVEGESSVDTSALTGESVPRTVRTGDSLLSGSVNQSGVLVVKVTKAYGESTASKIIDLVENASSRKAPSENFITSFARYYTPAVVVAALLLAFLPPLLLDAELLTCVRRALMFLVISCPCALVISVPLAFFGGIGAASRRGILVKGGNYLEALNKVETVVFDKTGTLTKGVFEVSEVLPDNGVTREELLKYTALAESLSNHPIAVSVIDEYGSLPDSVNIEDYTELAGRGVCATVNGARVLCGNTRLMEENGIVHTECTFTGTKIYTAIDGKYAGCIVISDEIKEDSFGAVKRLKEMGVKKTVMLTGDGEETARFVANRLGIDEYRAGLLPGQKVEIFERINGTKRKGSKTVFVGDGINDAPVLALADVGVAMGGLGSDAAIEAADVVLMTDEPSKLASAVEVANNTKCIVLQNIIFALGVKALFLVLGALGMTEMWVAVVGDVGVALAAVVNSMRILYK